MSNYKFVVFTGIDGAGKDFVANHFNSLDHGSSYIQTPTLPFNTIRHEIDDFALELPGAHFYFYLASVIHASKIVSERLVTGNVYCSRYLLDTVVYHRAVGLPVDLLYETSLYKIIRPDYTIFLDISDEKVRNARIEARGIISIGDIFVAEANRRDSILNEYNRYSSEFIRVNNTNRDINEVKNEILNKIKLPSSRGLTSWAK